MSKRVAVVVIALAGLVAATPAVSLGGKLGTKVAADSDRAKKPVAVAAATVNNPGKLTFKVKTKPTRRKVQWLYTTDCLKDGENHRYPTLNPPDQFTRSPFRQRMRKAVPNPDRCRVQVAAKLGHSRKKRRVTVKIFHKR